MTKNKKVIFIDSAEPFFFDEMFKRKGYSIIRARIRPSGDYAWGNNYQLVYNEKTKENHVTLEDGVIMERKTVEDFDGSFAHDNSHLWDQLQRMQINAEETDIRHFYDIIGDSELYNEYAGITRKHRLGAFNSARARYPNVQITFISTETAFVDSVDKLYRSYFEGKYGKARKLAFKTSNYGSYDEYVLCGIPGISIEKAKAILEEFEIAYTLIWRHQQQEEFIIPPELTEISGIGPKTAKKIREIMRL